MISKIKSVADSKRSPKVANIKLIREKENINSR
jgi:hypothetical protein